MSEKYSFPLKVVWLDEDFRVAVRLSCPELEERMSGPFHLLALTPEDLAGAIIEKENSFLQLMFNRAGLVGKGKFRVEHA